MSSPLPIGIAGGARDREIASSLLRGVLERGKPYQRVGIIGAHELFDGIEWKRRPDVTAELDRFNQHLANAEKSGLAHLAIEVDDLAQRSGEHTGLLCTIGAGGAGTARLDGRSLSFSARSPLADVGASDIEAHYGYVQLRAHTPTWSERLAVPLAGTSDLGPALAVIAICVLLDVDAENVVTGLLYGKTPGHGETLFSPDHQVVALVEESRAHRDTERLVAAARKAYEAFRLEIVHGTEAIPDAVAQAYARPEEEHTLLVLLGAAASQLEDAFQAAVRSQAALRRDR